MQEPDPLLPPPSCTATHDAGITHKFGAGVSLCRGLGIGLQRLSRVFGQTAGHLHLSRRQHITVGAVSSPSALSTNPEGATVGRTSRNLQSDGLAARYRNLDLRA